MKKLPAWLAVLLLVLGLGLVAPSTASAAPYCGITWGSQAKTKSLMVQSPIINVRSGRHACFDRLVVDLKGKAPGYTVRYVKTVHAEGSGKAIPLRGAADLSITVRAPAYNSAGKATYVPKNRKELVNLAGYRTFRQAAWGGSFEGVTTIGLGVRARLPFRVFTLKGQNNVSMLVIDVAHRW
ncbi:AMIN-like domain-containing (lipo)protein [Arthrobacter mobilis]|uniref:AMIN-like domain-containing protein n=1 Tax=Arthrobacter mobilis TaxID=2724944 RepID=A0A7X6HBR2_9MICC|nr:hypothetical protein [Arthrobacter mobilis]NKX54162.1 hypothetical protein [Arthrobacter mobilis]